MGQPDDQQTDLVAPFSAKPGDDVSWASHGHLGLLQAAQRFIPGAAGDRIVEYIWDMDIDIPYQHYQSIIELKSPHYDMIHIVWMYQTSHNCIVWLVMWWYLTIPPDSMCAPVCQDPPICAVCGRTRSVGNLAIHQAIDSLTWTGLPKPVVEDASKKITATRSARRDLPKSLFCVVFQKLWCQGLWSVSLVFQNSELCPTPADLAEFKKDQNSWSQFMETLWGPTLEET